MPTRFTRQTVTISSKDGFANAADAGDLFALQPNEVPGNLPPEQPDEESVTLRVIKRPHGVDILTRFSNRGIDAHAVGSMEMILPGDHTDKLIAEITEWASGLFKSLLAPHPPEVYRKEVERGVFEAVTTGRKLGKVSASEDISRRTRERIETMVRAGLPEREITAGKVADIEFRWSESNLRRQLHDHRLPSFRELKRDVIQTVRKTPP